MSYDCSNDSPFGTDALLEENWQKSSDHQHAVDLQAIADFNVAFDAENDSNTIDTQLAFGKSTNTQPDHQFDAAFAGLDQTLSPEPPSFGASSSSLGDQANGAPYFHSVETTSVPTFQQPPHMRNQQLHHRRSVSEPPIGPPPAVPQMQPQQPHQQKQQQQPGPAVMFHRDNHFLGKPIGPKPVPLKSQYKNRPQRQHMSARNKQRMEPYPRPDLRRSQTQPIRQVPPTSAPIHHLPPQYYQHPQHYTQMQMMTPEPQYVSSRVCTPAPENRMLHHNIDPALTGPPTPAVIADTTMPQQGCSQNDTVSIPLTVEELRSMIFDAVQRAVRGEEKSTPIMEEDVDIVHGEEIKAEEREAVVEGQNQGAAASTQ